MKIRSYYVVLALIIIVLTLPFAGCKGIVSGSGNTETQDYEISNFTQVEISETFSYQVLRSNFYSVVVTADDNILDEYVQVSKTGERLEVGLKPDHIYNSLTLNVVITMPALHSLQVSGVSRGSVEGFDSTHDLIVNISGASNLDLIDLSIGDVDFEVSGASSITGNLTAVNTTFEVSGASNIQLEGSAQKLELTVSGASRAELSGFSVHDVNASLSGASRGTINLDGRLDADISGLSRLTYLGEPVFGIIQTTGGSTLDRE
jgi:hypothetical protein